MNKTGPTGSALMILVFTVLCLAVFSVITLSSALADKTLAEKAAETVKSYYEADTLAERTLAEIIDNKKFPPTGISAFSCPISENKELYAEVLITENSYDILKWHVQDTGVWEADLSLPVWDGN